MNARLIAPSQTSGRNPMTVIGRTYSAAEGATVEAPPQDAAILLANGWRDAGPAADGDAGSPLEITGSRELTVNDRGRLLYSNSSSAITLSVVFNLPPEFDCAVAQLGTGKVTLAAGEGVTLNSIGGNLSTSAQYATIGIMGVRAGAFVVSGSTGA